MSVVRVVVDVAKMDTSLDDDGRRGRPHPHLQRDADRLHAAQIRDGRERAERVS